MKEHGEYTTRQIAEKTLLPITTIHNRIKKLRNNKIIKKYTIELDPIKTGKSFIAYVLISVNLQILKQKEKTQYDLIKEISKMNFIERIDIVSGEADLVAILRVKDVEEFDKVLLGKLQLLDGIEKTQSLIVVHGN